MFRIFFTIIAHHILSTLWRFDIDIMIGTVEFIDQVVLRPTSIALTPFIIVMSGSRSLVLILLLSLVGFAAASRE
jgi:hypothetical protein